MPRRIEVEIIGDPRSLEAAMGRAVTSTQRLQRGLDPVARGAKRALLGLGVLAAGAAHLALNFDRTSSRIVGLAGVGEKQVERWKDAMLDLGPIVGKTPQELSEALYFIASSGAAASDALDILDKSARASTAGLGETQVVADAVTSAMNAYGRENLNAAKATDILVATVREGKGEADAIAGAIGNAIPMAAQLGVGFEEVGAALAAMTRVGFDAATATTNLSGVFNALIKPAKDSQEALREIGTSAEEVRKMLGREGLLATLQFLEDAFGGNEAAMARVFRDVRGFRAVLTLVGKSGDDTARVFERMGDTTGALAHAFAAVDPEAMKMDQAMAEIQASGIQMGRMILPLLADMAGGFADAASFAAAHEDATRAVAIAVAGLSTALIVANTALKVYNSNLVMAAGAQGALKTLARFAGPIGLVALAIGGTAVALDRLGLTTSESERAFRKAEDAARNYKAALDQLKPSTDAIKDAELRVEAAELAVARARRNMNETLKTNTRGSLAAREASYALRQARRDLQRAEDDLGRSQADRRYVVDRVRRGEQAAQKATEDMRQAIQKTTRTYGAQRQAAFSAAGSTDAFRKAANAPAVSEYADRMRRLARDFGGAKTQAGNAALTVADLAKKLGRLPTRKEINLVVNADRAYDAIENLRARVSAGLVIPIFPRIVRPETRQHGGPVKAGMPYVVGERRPELFIPNTSGRIMSRVPSGGGGPPILVRLELNGRVLAEQLVDPLRAASARYARASGGRELL